MICISKQNVGRDGNGWQPVDGFMKYATNLINLHFLLSRLHRSASFNFVAVVSLYIDLITNYCHRNKATTCSNYIFDDETVVFLKLLEEILICLYQALWMLTLRFLFYFCFLVLELFREKISDIKYFIYDH